MPKVFTAPFAQNQKTRFAVNTAACVIGAADAPTNTSALATMGADGGIVTKISCVARATVTATAMYLFVSKDNGVTMRLIDSVLVAANTLAATTAIPVIFFGNVSETTPLRLDAGDTLHVGASVALTAGIVTRCEWTDL